jgi:carbamoyl-phosphate synthase large subunit
LVVNTTSGKESILDSYSIRRTALTRNVPYFTTIQGALAAAAAIESHFRKDLTVRTLQEYFQELK